MNPYDKLLHTIFRITVFTLALVIVTVVGVMCKALFDPQVDNKEIFAMLSPAFNTVIGAFVGLLGGISLTRPSKEDMFPTPPVVEPAPVEVVVEEPTPVVEEVVEDVVAPEPVVIVEEAPKKAGRKKI